MKRLVTYLYEYDKGRRGKNTGFIKADIYKEETHVAVFLQNIVQKAETGKVYLLVKENGLVGICIGDLYAEAGHGDMKIKIENTQIKGSRFSIQDVVGVAIVLGSTRYLASCWKEEYEEEIILGEFGKWESMQDEEVFEDSDLSQAEECIPMRDNLEVATISEKEEYLNHEITPLIECEEEPREEVTHQKIELSDIRSLPSPNWHFCNNSFLVHGFWNYGYLVLKKEITETEENLFLGVPGIFEKPEMVMAVVFGFTDFEEAPPEIIKGDMGTTIVTKRKEKNQEPKVGEFGCWFVKLKR